MNWGKQTVFLDVETTDINHRPIEIVEIGAVKVSRQGETIGTFEQLIRPTHLENVTEFCQNLTEISPTQLVNEPGFASIWKNFAEFTNWKACPVICFTGFDQFHLHEEYDKRLVDFPHSVPFVDALSWVKSLEIFTGIDFPSYRLNELCGYFNLRPETTHTALGGAFLLKQVSYAVLDRWKSAICS